MKSVAPQMSQFLNRVISLNRICTKLGNEELIDSLLSCDKNIFIRGHCLTFQIDVSSIGKKFILAIARLQGLDAAKSFR